MTSKAREAMTRPIIGIANRTPQEVFDIMCDRAKAFEAQIREECARVAEMGDDERKAAENGLVPPKTIYDDRIEVQRAAEKAGPELYVALKDLLEAVDERWELRKSIESATIQRAHMALLTAAPKAIRGGGNG